jgi:hypothetical protein
MSAGRNTNSDRHRKEKQKAVMRFIAEQLAWPSKMSDSADVKLSSKENGDGYVGWRKACRHSD